MGKHTYIRPDGNRRSMGSIVGYLINRKEIPILTI